MTSLMIAPLYAAICGLGLLLLSFRVIGLRRRFRISIGSQGNADLERAIRVQGNFAEYAPMFLILLILAEMQGLGPAVLHGTGIAFLAGRAAHTAAFSGGEKPGLPRILGMVLTLGSIATLAVTMLSRRFF